MSRRNPPGRPELFTQDMRIRVPGCPWPYPSYHQESKTHKGDSSTWNEVLSYRRCPRILPDRNGVILRTRTDELEVTVLTGIIRVTMRKQSQAIGAVVSGGKIQLRCGQAQPARC